MVLHDLGGKYKSLYFKHSHAKIIAAMQGGSMA
jgi:hypothetical protein